MSRTGQAFSLPRYEAIPLSEHSQTLELVVEMGQSQPERIALREETGVQVKDERALWKGEKPRPKITPSTLPQDTPEGAGPSRGQQRQERGAGPGKQAQELESHETPILYPEQMPAGSVCKGSADYRGQGLRITRHDTT